MEKLGAEKFVRKIVDVGATLGLNDTRVIDGPEQHEDEDSMRDRTASLELLVAHGQVGPDVVREALFDLGDVGRTIEQRIEQTRQLLGSVETLPHYLRIIGEKGACSWNDVQLSNGNWQSVGRPGMIVWDTAKKRLGIVIRVVQEGEFICRFGDDVSQFVCRAGDGSFLKAPDRDDIGHAFYEDVKFAHYHQFAS